MGLVDRCIGREQFSAPDRRFHETAFGVLDIVLQLCRSLPVSGTVQVAIIIIRASLTTIVTGMQNHIAFTIDDMHESLRGKQRRRHHPVHFFVGIEMLHRTDDLVLIHQRHGNDENFRPIDP